MEIFSPFEMTVDDKKVFELLVKSINDRILETNERNPLEVSIEPTYLSENLQDNLILLCQRSDWGRICFETNEDYQIKTIKIYKGR